VVYSPKVSLRSVRFEVTAQKGIQMRVVSFLIVLMCMAAPAMLAQTQKSFPTDDEINLILTQTERAIQQYKPLIDQEQVQMGKDGAESAAKDRQNLDALETALKAFRSKPQAFNGPLGLIFFGMLDDADRNAVLCGSGASSQATVQLMDGNVTKADSLVHLAQSCADVSALIYTVSENAESLYQRYVEAEEQLANRGAEAAEKCMAILKKNGVQPKK
jgi:hypothetical protein